MNSQKAQGITTMAPSCRGKSHFTLRGRMKTDSAIKGKLRIHSMPGALMVLGVIVVIVGTALAMAGYWPYRIAKSSFLGAAVKGYNKSQTSDWSLGSKGLLSVSPIHSEQMKLLGPVIMGVGLFILVCANTVLYENRDRETQMLLAQRRSVVCSVSTAVPSAELKEVAVANSMTNYYQWVSSLPAAHLNILSFQQLARSEPLLQTRQPRDQEEYMGGIYQLAVLQTEAFHHHELEGPASLCSSHFHSCISNQKMYKNSQSGGEHRGSVISQHFQLIKLNSCLVSASSMSTLGMDEVCSIKAAQSRRCHSVSCRTNHHVSRVGLSLDKGSKEIGLINLPNVIRREAGSEVCLDIPKQIEEQTHRSWPQLDMGIGRRYLKLENKQDSVDKLLDQLEQQCFQWDKTFGSGPFQ